jgi:hypothetical protein
MGVLDYEDIAVADLRFNLKNPRHDPVRDQRAAISALLRDDGRNLVKLAEDIATHGISPVDMLLVVPDSGSSSTYTVIEGNRRLAALKLLGNPELAAEFPALRDRLKKVAAAAFSIPHQARCVVVAKRDDAKHWQVIRHGVEQTGPQTKPWSSEARHRFAGQKASQTGRATIFADAIAAAYSDDEQLMKDLEKVRRDRITTLGRLVSDPDVRDEFGVDFEAGGVVTHYSAELVKPAVARVLKDLTGKVNVRDLDTKTARKRYARSLRDVLPDVNKWMSEPVPLSGAPPTKLKKKPGRRQPVAADAKPLYEGVELTNLGERVAALLREIKQIDVDRFPNAAAALNRVLMEIAVSQVLEQKGLQPKKLREAVKYCLAKIDPTGRNLKFQPVRQGLNDGTSMLSVQTMHALIHNANWHPAPSEVRSIARNYAPFLAALDGLV